MNKRKYQATVIEKIPQDVLVIPCVTLAQAMVIATALNTGSVNTRVLQQDHQWCTVRQVEGTPKYCVVLV